MTAQISMRYWRSHHLSSIAYFPEESVIRLRVGTFNEPGIVTFTAENIVGMRAILLDTSSPAIVPVQRLADVEFLVETDADGEEIEFFNYSIQDKDLIGFYRGEREDTELVFISEAERLMFAHVLFRHYGFEQILQDAVDNKGCISASPVS